MEVGVARKTRRALVLTLAGLMLAGCGGPSSLDQESTQDAVADALVDRLPASVSVSAVACPERIERAKGAKVTCTVTLADNVGELPVTAVQRDNDGRVTVQPGGAVLANEAVADQLAASLKESFERTFQVDCGDDGYVARTIGASFPCRANDKTSRRSVDVTVVDAAGTLSFNVLAEGN